MPVESLRPIPVLLPTGHRLEVPTIPSISSINLLEQLTELKETLRLTNLLKNMIKDTNEQPDKVIHRLNSGRVQVQEPPTLWSCGVSGFAHLESLTIGILWRLPHIGMIN